MSTVADLWALQTTDLAIEALRQRLAGLEKQKGETPALIAARQAAAAADHELVGWREKQRDLDTQMRDLSNRIRAAERDLMSGRVRNAKELEGMEANVAALKRRRSALEEEDLAAMLEIERCQAQADAARAALVSTEAQWQAGQAKLADDLNRSVVELKTLATRLNHQWEAIAPQDKELYRSLRQRKGGRALALERDGDCTACGVTLPTGGVQAVHGGEERVFCPSCGRLLFAQL
jgi:hypothetical protein